mmetsp:Transcript_68043/g.160166  ORF Transcript_68043/g.160166 Transcript_68043/m.160166 type:complete len:247 (-) Transcript_68043:701-1441(-)
MTYSSMSLFCARKDSSDICCDSASSSNSSLPSSLSTPPSPKPLSVLGLPPERSFDCGWGAGPAPWPGEAEGQPSTCKRASSIHTWILVHSSLEAALSDPGWPQLRNWAFMDIRRNARLTWSGERSATRSRRGSPISCKHPSKASSRTCCGSLENTSWKSELPELGELSRQPSAKSPERTLSTAPPRKSGAAEVSDASGRSMVSAAPCSSTSMQCRPPRWPATHCLMACREFSDKELQSRSAPLSGA